MKFVLFEGGRAGKMHKPRSELGFCSGPNSHCQLTLLDFLLDTEEKGPGRERGGRGGGIARRDRRRE